MVVICGAVNLPLVGQVPDAAVAAVVTGAVGLVSTAVTQLASAIQTRARHVQAVNAAKADVEFWQLWLKAQELAQPPDGLERVREIARRELDHVYLTVVARKQELNVASLAHAVPRSDVTPSSFRRALLLYAPVRSAAWVPRVSFWSLLALGVIGMFGAYTTPDAGETPMQSAGLALLGLAFLVLVVGLPLRAWSVRLDRRPAPAAERGEPAAV